jgi:hypothetical protein
MTYVESAILRIIDEATAPAKRIDDVLKGLHRTAASFGAKSIDFKITSSSLTSIESRVAKLISQVSNIQGKINVAGGSSINRAQSQPNPASTYYSGGSNQHPGMMRRAAGYAVASVAGSAMHHASSEGWKASQDISANREIVGRLGWNDKETALMKATASHMASQYGTASVGEYERIFREVAEATHEPSDAKKLMPGLSKYMHDSVAMGMDPHRAADGAQRLIKSTEMLGAMLDKDGHVDTKKFGETLDTLTRAQLLMGSRQLDTRQLQNFAKYSRTGGYALNQDALAKSLFFAGEEGGSTLGTMLNSMITNLGGRAPGEQKAKLVQLGLATGTITKGPAGTKVTDYKLIDDKMMRTDPFEYLNRVFNGPNGVLARNGINPNDRAEVAAFAQTILGRATSQDLFSKILSQAGETANKLASIKKIDTSPERASRAGLQNMRVANAEFTQGLKTFTERLSTNFESIIAPALHHTGRALTSISERATGPVALGVGAAAWAANAAINNPGSAAHMAAAAAHMRAASYLSAAAMKLGLGGMAGGLSTAQIKQGLGKANSLGLGATLAGGAVGGSMLSRLYQAASLGNLGRMMLAPVKAAFRVLTGPLGTAMMVDQLQSYFTGFSLTDWIMTKIAGMFKPTDANAASSAALAEAARDKRSPTQIGLDNAVAKATDAEQDLRLQIAALGDNKSADAMKERSRLEKALNVAIAARTEAETNAAREASVQKVIEAAQDASREMWGRSNYAALAANTGTDQTSGVPAIRAALGGLTVGQANALPPERQQAIDDAIDVAIVAARAAETEKAELAAWRSKIDPARSANSDRFNARGIAEDQARAEAREQATDSVRPLIAAMAAIAADARERQIAGIEPPKFDAMGNPIGGGGLDLTEVARPIENAGEMASAQLTDGGFSAQQQMLEGGASAGEKITSAGGIFQAAVESAASAFASMISGLSINVGAASETGRASNTGSSTGVGR